MMKIKRFDVSDHKNAQLQTTQRNCQHFSIKDVGDSVSFGQNKNNPFEASTLIDLKKLKAKAGKAWEEAVNSTKSEFTKIAKSEEPAKQAAENTVKQELQSSQPKEVVETPESLHKSSFPEPIPVETLFTPASELLSTIPKELLPMTIIPAIPTTAIAEHVPTTEVLKKISSFPPPPKEPVLEVNMEKSFESSPSEADITLPFNSKPVDSKSYSEEDLDAILAVNPQTSKEEAEAMANDDSLSLEDSVPSWVPTIPDNSRPENKPVESGSGLELIEIPPKK